MTEMLATNWPSPGDEYEHEAAIVGAESPHLHLLDPVIPEGAYEEDEDEQNDSYQDGVSLDSLTTFIRQAEIYPLLKAYEEVELAKAIERGDKSAKDRLVGSNVRLLISLADKYQGQGVQLTDLIQEGAFGLIRAAEKFDWRRGFKFSTYGTWWIKQALRRAVQNHSRDSRLPVDKNEILLSYKRTVDYLRQEDQREPKVDEVAYFMDIPVKKLQQLLIMDKQISLNAPVKNSEGEQEFGDMQADTRPSAQTESQAIQKLSELELIEMIKKCPQGITKLEYEVLQCRFGLGGSMSQSLEATGKELDLTTREVRGIERNALNKLRDKEQEQEPDFTEAVAQLKERARNSASNSQSKDDGGVATLQEYEERRAAGERFTLDQVPIDYWWTNGINGPVPRSGHEMLGKDF